MPIDAVAFSGAHFGVGTGPIFLDNVGCSGSERNLTDCPHSSTVYCYRGHSEDAGVRCQGRSAGSCICSSSLTYWSLSPYTKEGVESLHFLPYIIGSNDKMCV